MTDPRTPTLLSGMADDLTRASARFADHGHMDCRQIALDCAAIAKRLAREAVVEPVATQ